MEKSSIILTQRTESNVYHWKHYEIKIPINLDFNDEQKKQLIYDAWSNDRNLPTSYAREYASIDQLSKFVRFEEMALAKKKGVCYFVLSFKANCSQRDKLISNIEQCFSNCDIILLK